MERHQQRFIGIDLSKRTYEAVALTESSDSIQRWNGKLDPHGRIKLTGKLREGDLVACEAGTASFLLVKELQKVPGVKVVVLNAANLAVIYASLKKTDKEDALKLARLVQKFSLDELPTVPIPTDEEMERRELVAHENRFNRDRTMLINRLHAVFVRAGFPDHVRAELGKREIRERCSVEELTGFNCSEALNLNHMITEYETILKDLMVRINASVMSAGEDAKIILSIPGIGIKTTMAILAYAGTMQRFDTPAQLVNYIGFSPRLYASGDISRTGSITKRGNPLVRGLLVQSAWGLIKSTISTPLKMRYEAMLQRGKAKSVAIVAVARKILELVYILLIRREYYRCADTQRFLLKLKKIGFETVGAESS